MAENKPNQTTAGEAEKKVPQQLSETAGMGNCNMEDVMQLFDSISQAPVELTDKEITEAKKNRNEFNNQYRSFNKAPIYRCLHSMARTLIDITMLMPKKTGKITDNVLGYYSEVMRWTASAYEQDRKKPNILRLVRLFL